MNVGAEILEVSVIGGLEMVVEDEIIELVGLLDVMELAVTEIVLHPTRAVNVNDSGQL